MKVQLLALVIALLKCTDCLALTYTHQIVFNGQVIYDGTESGWETVYGDVRPGDTFSGTLLYSFSDDTMPVSAGIPNVYDPHSTVGLNISYNISFDTFSVSSQNDCWLVLRNGSANDTFSLVDGRPLLNPGYLPLSIDDLTIELYDLSAGSIDAAYSLPSLESYASGRIIVSPAFSPALNIVGQINEIQSVHPLPEPTTMVLFGFGIAALAFVGRRRRA